MKEKKNHKSKVASINDFVLFFIPTTKFYEVPSQVDRAYSRALSLCYTAINCILCQTHILENRRRTTLVQRRMGSVVCEESEESKVGFVMKHTYTYIYIYIYMDTQRLGKRDALENNVFSVNRNIMRDFWSRTRQVSGFSAKALLRVPLQIPWREFSAKSYAASQHSHHLFSFHGIISEAYASSLSFSNAAIILCIYMFFFKERSLQK